MSPARCSLGRRQRTAPSFYRPKRVSCIREMKWKGKGRASTTGRLRSAKLAPPPDLLSVANPLVVCPATQSIATGSETREEQTGNASQSKSEVPFPRSPPPVLLLRKKHRYRQDIIVARPRQARPQRLPICLRKNIDELLQLVLRDLGDVRRRQREVERSVRERRALRQLRRCQTARRASSSDEVEAGARRSWHSRTGGSKAARGTDDADGP